MRVIFAGTPQFAATVLARLLHSNNSVELVLTQPDKPTGRGLRSNMGPVKRLALNHGIALQQPTNLRSEGVEHVVAACKADVCVVAAYGAIFPERLLAIPRLGCINVHASLLPRWRGAAPVQRAIMAGDAETGICIMQMERGLDAGPVYMCKRTPIAASDTAGSLHDRLATLGGEAVCEVLDRLRAGTLTAEPQPLDGITYASKILRDDTRVRWERPAAEVERLVRALNPSPGAYAEYEALPLKLWGAEVCESIDAPSGTVLAANAAGIEVRCRDAGIRITELQRAGGRRMSAREFLRGFTFRAGSRFSA